MIREKISYVFHLLFFIGIVVINNVYSQTIDNLNFETGTTSGWTITQGLNKDATTMAGCCTETNVNPAGFSIIDSAVTKVDPNIPLLRAYPRNGGRYNLRLGVNNVNVEDSTAMRAVKKFTVEADKALLVVDYAAVLGGSAPHTCDRQPYFQIRVMACDGTPIVCGKRNVIVPNSECTQSDVSDFSKYVIPFPPFGNWGEPVFYLSYTDWKRVSYDLRDYIGQCITIELTTASCRNGGHKGYVYFDTDCKPFELSVDGVIDVLDPGQMSAKSVTIQGCTDDSMNIVLQAQKGFASYVWSGPGVNNVRTDNIITSQPGSYKVTMTPVSLDNTNVGTCKTTTVTINLNPPRTSPKGELLISDNEVCVEKSLDFQSQVLSAGTGESVTNTALMYNSSSVVNEGNGKFTFKKVGQESIRYEVTNTAGCTNVSQKNIRVKPEPQPPRISNENVCMLDTLTVYGTNLKWYDVDTNLLVSSPEMTTVSNIPVIYFVTQSVESCESDKAKMSVVVKATPKITGIQKEEPDCYGYLKGSISVNVDESFGRDFLYSLIGYKNFQPSGYFKNVPTGKYLIQVTSPNGCTDRDTVSIVAKNDDCELLMPSAFTPNRDGINDIFRPASYSLMGDYTLQIYNRLGRLMYGTSSPCEGWDGTTAGEPQPAGVYIWHAQYRNGNNEMKERTGTVVLIR